MLAAISDDPLLLTLVILAIIALGFLIFAHFRAR
jgi:hypothetical protein